MVTKSYEKMLDEIGNMSVVELADFVKALEEKFGVTAAMPVASAGAPAAAVAAPEAEKKSAYKVTLKEGGPDKIKTIKALRQVMQGLNLSDAKKMVEEAPALIAESAPKDDAEKIKKELEAVGAKVELV